VALVHESGELFDKLGDTCGVVRLALDEQVTALRPYSDVQQRLEIPQIIVIGPDECLESRFGDRYLTLWGGRNVRYLLKLQLLTRIDGSKRGSGASRLDPDPQFPQLPGIDL
jgi:hypothetical protein